MDLITVTFTYKVFPFAVLKAIIDAYINQEIEPKFQEFDKDRNGTIDKKELGVFMETLGFYLPKDELKKAFDVLDSDHSGTITKENFRDWLLMGQPMPGVTGVPTSDFEKSLTREEFISKVKFDSGTFI